jgi:hypothetical protein
MRRQIMARFNPALAAITALALIAAPAVACDPEDLKAEYRALCATPTDLAVTLVGASAAKLPREMATHLLEKAKHAQALCLADKYDDAMQLAMRVVKVLGSIEQEVGVPRDQLALSATDTIRVAGR